MSQPKYPLTKGDVVNLHFGMGDHPIEHAGMAGFSVKGKLGMYRWTDRGVTWSSDKLDRLDATREQFRQAAGKE